MPAQTGTGSQRPTEEICAMSIELGTPSNVLRLLVGGAEHASSRAVDRAVGRCTRKCPGVYEGFSGYTGLNRHIRFTTSRERYPGAYGCFVGTQGLGA